MGADANAVNEDAEPGNKIGSPSTYWTPNASPEEGQDVKPDGPLHSLITRKQHADLSFQVADRPVLVLATPTFNQSCQDEFTSDPIISDQGRGEDSGANEPLRSPHSLPREIALSVGTVLVNDRMASRI